MALVRQTTKLTPPRMYLAGVAVFLALAAFIAFILHRQIKTAFQYNPGLNGLILGVLALGVLFAVVALIRLYRDVLWVNAWTDGYAKGPTPPMLAPLARLAGERRPLSTLTLRAILDSISARLDESRETLRYLTGLLIFLGLLGTFWGLLETVSSIGQVINAMSGGADIAGSFEKLKAGISGPLQGMSLSFTASLFGLAGSLILGFLDLQVGQAQNRFYIEIEDLLTERIADETPSQSNLVQPGFAQPQPVSKNQELNPLNAASEAQTLQAAAAMANLAEGVQGLVQHMRGEQQMIRGWAEQQAEQNREIKKLLDRLLKDGGSG